MAGNDNKKYPRHHMQGGIFLIESGQANRFQAGMNSCNHLARRVAGSG